MQERVNGLVHRKETHEREQESSQGGNALKRRELLRDRDATDVP
jgi:hypothetical protein